MAALRREKTAPATVHMPRRLKLAIDHVASSDRRSFSAFLCRIAEEHPSVKIVLQQISASG